MEVTPGKIVQLKSGGPKMTVMQPAAGRRGWTCQWFDEKHVLQVGVFPAESLKEAEEPDPGVRKG